MITITSFAPQVRAGRPGGLLLIVVTLERHVALVVEFDSHRGEIILYLQKCNKKDQLLRVPSSVGRYNSMRVDEGRKC